MTSVLIVDDDAQLCKGLKRTLSAHGYHAQSATSYSEALTCLSAQAFDVMITDLRMVDCDGLQLLSTLRESALTTRPILMSAYATARDGQRAIELGAVRVLCKPFDTTEMIQAVEQAADASSGFVGHVHGLSLIDMLQMFHFARRSVTLHVLDAIQGSVSMKDGQVIDARHGELAGEDALRDILTLRKGSLQTSSLDDVVPTIEREFQSLLLDLVRQMDEHSRRGAARNRSDPEPLRASGRAPIPSLGVGAAGTERALSERAPTPPPSTSRELDEACSEIGAWLEGVTSLCVVDVVAGRLMGLYVAGEHSRARDEAFREGVLAMIRGARLLKVDQAEMDSVGDVDGPCDELHVISRQHLYLAQMLCDGRFAVVIVAPAARGVGPTSLQLRSAIAQLAPLLT